MKIAVCDVCYQSTNKIKDRILKPATNRIGRNRKQNGRTIESVKIDVCIDHKCWLNDCRTVAEARAKINRELFGIE